MTKQKRAVHVPARNAGPPGVLAGAAILAGCPADLDPGSTAAPALIGRGGQSTYPFAGHLYPRSGPLEYPGRWGTGGVLEVDAPLRSLVRDRERADFGPLYYSFTVNVRVEGLRTLRLQWEADGASTDLAKVSGPCDAQSGAAARAFMTDTSLRETGVATVAAYDMPINARLAGGEGLWWVTCEPDDPGEILSTTPARVDYNVAVLLPQSLFADERGRLLLRSQPLTQGPLSAALKIPIMETPRTFAVAGDSMAWGQGLFYQEKWWWRVYDKARSNNDEFDRLRARAVSGAPERRQRLDCGARRPRLPAQQHAPGTAVRRRLRAVPTRADRTTVMLHGRRRARAARPCARIFLRTKTGGQRKRTDVASRC